MDPITSNPNYSSSSVPTSDDKLWALFSHLGILVLIGPIVVFLTKGKEREFVGDQSKEALNFQISTFVISVAINVLSVILAKIVGILGMGLSCLGGLVGLAAFVFIIIASIKSYSGDRYRYPINFRFIK